jgi:ribosomal protein L37E
MAGFIERTVYTFECPRCGYVRYSKSEVSPKSCSACGYPGEPYREGWNYEYDKENNRIDFQIDWLELDRLYRK